MKVLITQPYGKDKLVEAFKREGAEVVSRLDSSVRLIVPTVDEELPFFSSSKDFFNPLGIKVMVSSPDTIHTCRDKAEFYRFCKRHGFGTPDTAQFEAIVKPRFGKGSKGITYINCSMILQEVIKFPEYSIDYFADFEGKTLSAIPRLRLDVVNGESKDGIVDKNPILVEQVTRLGQELGLVGHNTIQCFFSSPVVLFTEVNCRFGGGFWITQPEYNTVSKLLELVMRESNVPLPMSEVRKAHNKD